VIESIFEKRNINTPKSKLREVINA